METVVISLGGSVLAPSGIDTDFLVRFRELILRLVSGGKRFAIICGGGKTAREYMSAASKVVKLTSGDLDWLGIHATRLNAQLLRNIFRGVAYERVIHNPNEAVPKKEKVVIAAGWKPGRSTDYIAVMLARNLKAKSVINITNTSHVYDKDPSKFSDAVPLRHVAWKDFRKLIGASKWSPGLNTPFDPVAARAAERLKLRVAIMGSDLANLEGFLAGSGFDGTLIE